MTADALAHVGERELVAYDRTLHGELARRGRGRLWRPEPGVVRHASSHHLYGSLATRRDTRLAHAHTISTSRRRRVSTSVLIFHSPPTSS